MARRDHLLLTAEEIREHQAKRRRLALLIALTFALGLVIFFAARPTRNAIKGWQARRHAQKAFTFIEEAKWNDARQEALAAYQLRASEPQAIRGVARFLSRTHQPQAFEFWDLLAKHEPLTRDDLRDEAALGLASGETERAADAVARLFDADGKNATAHDWLLQAQLQLQQSAPAKALDSLGRIFAVPGASARDQFQAALLQLQAAHTGDPAVDERAQKDSWQRLQKFAQADDAVALDSLVLLAQRQLTDSKSGVESESLIRRIEAHPLAKAPQKLLAIDLQIAAHPEQKETLVRQAIERWKNAEPADLVVLATWLNGKGEYQLQLDSIPEEKALTSRELFLQRMDALGALDRWDEIRTLLTSERFPLDPVMQRMYLARTNAKLGEEAAAKNNWQRALEAAAGDAQKLLALAAYAEKNNAVETADAAYAEALAIFPRLRPAYESRLRLAQTARDTRRLHTILAAMLQQWPNDTAIQNDEAYTRLLLTAATKRETAETTDEGRASSPEDRSSEGESFTSKPEGLTSGAEELTSEPEKLSFGPGKYSSGSEDPAARPEEFTSTPKGDTSRTEVSPSKSENFASGHTLRSKIASNRPPAPENRPPEIEAQLLALEKLARDLIQREPASLPHRTLRALALLKLHRPAEALQVYESIQVATNALTPSALAVHAAVLAANDRPEDARKEAEQIPPDKLLPEEQALIAGL